MPRWVHAVLAFVGVFLGALVVTAVVGFGVGQYELLLLLVIAGAAAFAAYRPDLVPFRRIG